MAPLWVSNFPIHTIGFCASTISWILTDTVISFLSLPVENLNLKSFFFYYELHCNISQPGLFNSKIHPMSISSSDNPPPSLPTMPCSWGPYFTGSATHTDLLYVCSQSDHGAVCVGELSGSTQHPDMLPPG